MPSEEFLLHGFHRVQVRRFRNQADFKGYWTFRDGPEYRVPTTRAPPTCDLSTGLEVVEPRSMRRMYHLSDFDEVTAW